MKIKQLLTSPKGNLIAKMENGWYVVQINSMELAICDKVKEGYKIVKTVVSGKMMREHNDFVFAAQHISDKEYPTTNNVSTRLNSLISDIKKMYTVWVGGGEVNDNLIADRSEAEAIAQTWRDRGYDDVHIEEVSI